MHCSSTSTWEPKRSETGTNDGLTLAQAMHLERAAGWSWRLLFCAAALLTVLGVLWYVRIIVLPVMLAPTITPALSPRALPASTPRATSGRLLVELPGVTPRAATRCPTQATSSPCQCEGWGKTA
jgi:hypothetical protein